MRWLRTVTTVTQIKSWLAMNCFCILIKRQHNCFRIMNIDESRDSGEWFKNFIKSSFHIIIIAVRSSILANFGFRVEFFGLRDAFGEETIISRLESIRSLEIIWPGWNDFYGLHEFIRSFMWSRSIRSIIGTWYSHLWSWESAVYNYWDLLSIMMFLQNIQYDP